MGGISISHRFLVLGTICSFRFRRSPLIFCTEYSVDYAGLASQTYEVLVRTRTKSCGASIFCDQGSPPLLAWTPSIKGLHLRTSWPTGTQKLELISGDRDLRRTLLHMQWGAGQSRRQRMGQHGNTHAVKRRRLSAVSHTVPVSVVHLQARPIGKNIAPGKRGCFPFRRSSRIRPDQPVSSLLHMCSVFPPKDTPSKCSSAGLWWTWVLDTAALLQVTTPKLLQAVACDGRLSIAHLRGKHRTVYNADNADNADDECRSRNAVEISRYGP